MDRVSLRRGLGFGLSAVALSGAAAWLVLGEPAAEAPAVPAVPVAEYQRPDSLPVRIVPAAAAPVPTALPQGFELDERQHLRLNFALRLQFDQWLRSERAPGMAARAAELRSWIANNLPAPAAEDAERVLGAYLAYAKQHDELLAAQHFDFTPSAALPVAAIERLSSWKQQRAQLRQRTLGMELARIWFESDDGQMDDALAALRQRAGLAAPDDEPSESNRLRAERMRNAARDAADDLITTDIVARATTPYDHH